jgi:hypothetical protein
LHDVGTFPFYPHIEDTNLVGFLVNFPYPPIYKIMILCCSFRRFISSENTLLKTCALYVTKNNGKNNLYMRIKPATDTSRVEGIFADNINRCFNYMLKDWEESDVDFLS